MDVNMYGLTESQVVVLFQQVLPIGFGTDQGTVVRALPKADKSEGQDGTEGLQGFLEDHVPLVKSQVAALIKRMTDGDALELAFLFLRLLISFRHDTVAFILRWN